MRLFLSFTALTLIAACAPEEVEPSADTQAALSAELRNYEPAGEPVSCVNQRDLRGNRSAGDALVFTGLGDRLWVNRPAAGCPGLDSGRTLVTRTTTTQLCRGEIVSIVDPVSGFSAGSCSLGDFVPYRRLPR
jgi:hypothetical protein